MAKLSKKAAKDISSQINSLSVARLMVNSKIEESMPADATYWMRDFNEHADYLMQQYGIHVNKYEISQ